MAKTPRKKTLGPPRNAWETSLEETEGRDRSQAGEVEAGDEDGGGGNKGLDTDTGDGGYGGEAAEAGHLESASQTDQPLDRELQGDPRTHEGQSYPDEAKVVDPGQGPIGREPIEEETDEEEWKAE